MIDLYAPGSVEHAAGTSPHNNSGEQQPAYVAHPLGAEDVVDVVREAARRGLTLVSQASGHGAGGSIGENSIIVDTSGLDGVSIDVDARLARVGAGATWVGQWCGPTAWPARTRRVLTGRHRLRIHLRRWCRLVDPAARAGQRLAAHCPLRRRRRATAPRHGRRRRSGRSGRHLGLSRRGGVSASPSNWSSTSHPPPASGPATCCGRSTTSMPWSKRGPKLEPPPAQRSRPASAFCTRRPDRPSPTNCGANPSCTSPSPRWAARSRRPRCGMLWPGYPPRPWTPGRVLMRRSSPGSTSILPQPCRRSVSPVG